MGSGKSQVSKFLSSSYPVLDCDKVNAHLLEKGQAGYQALNQAHLVVLDQTGNIDKVALSQAMFQSSARKQQVESILHPLILSAMKQWAHQQTSSLVFMEVPLLFETHVEFLFDSIWCVVTSKEVALERLQKYRHISPQQANARLAHQMDPQTKIQKSDVVLYNDGTLDDLYKNIQRALKMEGSHVEL